MSAANGTAPPPRDVRAELREARAELALERTRAEMRDLKGRGELLENYWGFAGRAGIVSPFDSFPGTDWWQGQPLAAGDRTGRRDGYNRPFVWSDIDLDLMRSQARWIATKNPFGVGLLSHLVNFTVRTGYQWEAKPGEGVTDPAAEPLARAVGRFIKRHCDLNNWPRRERSFVRRAVRDGDALLRHFPQRDGTTLVRSIEPEQLRQPVGTTEEYSQGILTDPDDVELALKYAVHYRDHEVDEVDAEDVVHCKRNVDETIKRGLSDFFSTDEALDAAAKLVKNMLKVGAVRAAVPWFEQFEGATATGVSGQIAGARDQNRTPVTDPLTGREINYQRYEAGTIPKFGRGRSLLPMPAGVTAENVSVVQTGLRAVSARWGMPEYFTGDASNANYASTLVSGSPFVTAIECEQDEFRGYFLRSLWTAVRNAAKAGLIRVNGRAYGFEEIQALVDLIATPPQVAIANKAEEADVDGKDMAAGVMSKQERARRRNLDWDQMAREQKQAPHEPPPQQGQPGAPPPSPFGESVAGRLARLREEYGDAADVVAGAARRLLEGGAEPADDHDERRQLVAEILAALLGDEALDHLDDIEAAGYPDEAADDVEESRLTRYEDADLVPLWEAATARKPGDKWQGPSGRWFTKRPDGRVVPAAGDKKDGGGKAKKAAPAKKLSPAERKQAAKDGIAAVLKGDRSPEAVATLTDHLSALTVADLNALKKEHGIKGGAAKADLVKRVAERLPFGGNKPDGQLPFGDKPAAPAAPEPKPKAPEPKAKAPEPKAAPKADHEKTLGQFAAEMGFDAAQAREFHRPAVAHALKQGQAVPAEVLKDYPDLTPKAKAEPAAPAAEKPAPAKKTAPKATPKAEPKKEPAKAEAAFEASPGNPHYERHRNAVLDGYATALRFKDSVGGTVETHVLYGQARQHDDTLTPERFRATLAAMHDERSGEVHVRNEVGELTPAQRELGVSRGGKHYGYFMHPDLARGAKQAADLKRPVPGAGK
jgi:hypothetical protein